MKEWKPSSSGSVKLTEEQEFLLRSLDDLEKEHSNGDLSDNEYETLQNDYTHRLASVTRHLAGAATPAPSRDSKRYLWWVAVIAVAGIAAGYAVAQSSGLRAPGEPLSGEIDRSPRNRLASAQSLFFANDLEGARGVIEEVLRDAPEMTEALVLSAQIHERTANPLAAVQQLDQVLEREPKNIDALTLRGWILVRIDEPDVQVEGIRSLDEAISLQPAAYEPYIFRGFVARELQNDLILSIEMYEMALERDPPDAMRAELTRIIEEMSSELQPTTE